MRKSISHMVFLGLALLMFVVVACGSNKEISPSEGTEPQTVSTSAEEGSLAPKAEYEATKTTFVIHGVTLPDVNTTGIQPLTVTALDGKELPTMMRYNLGLGLVKGASLSKREGNYELTVDLIPILQNKDASGKDLFFDPMWLGIRFRLHFYLEPADTGVNVHFFVEDSVYKEEFVNLSKQVLGSVFQQFNTK